MLATNEADGNAGPKAQRELEAPVDRDHARIRPGLIYPREM